MAFKQKFDVGSLDLDVEATETFKPNCISYSHGPEIFRGVPESVKVYAKKLLADGWKIYPVKQSRGRCYYREKVITIPVWVIDRGNIKKKTWYISHEIAHALDITRSHHGDAFMEKRKEICPADCIHFELGYKPRNAARAGIVLNLEL